MSLSILKKDLTHLVIQMNEGILRHFGAGSHINSEGTCQLYQHLLKCVPSAFLFKKWLFNIELGVKFEALSCFAHLL